MEEYASGIRQTLRLISLPELQSKDSYFKKEIKTYSPERFLRNLADGIGELGYKFNSDVEARIRSGAFGESGYIKRPFVATKTVPARKRRNPRLLIGIGFTAVGAALAFVIVPLGLIFMGIGELSLILWLQNRKEFAEKNKKPANTTSRIWLLLEGGEQREVQAAAQPESGGQQAKRVSVLTVHAAAEPDDEKAVQLEIQKLANRLDLFA